MAILNVNTSSVGTVGQLPRFVYLMTNDNLSTITSTGYLNQLVQSGTAFYPSDLAIVYGTNICNGDAGPNIFQVTVTGNSQPYQYGLAEINSY